MTAEDYDDLYGDLYGDVDAKPVGGSAAASSTSPGASANPAASSTSTGTTKATPAASTATGTTPAPTGLVGQSKAFPNTVRPSDMPDEGKMFIGGLNWDTTDDSLRSYFEQFGTVTHCTIMRNPETHQSRGFAFLTFDDPASVNVVMQREHYLDGKTIDPKRAIPRSEGIKTDKLFVRNIPPSCTQESFRSFWRQFGPITDATLMMDKESGRHRGFGFVNYENGDTVEKVLTSGPHVMDGAMLEVKRAQTKEQQSRMHHGGYNNNYNNRNQSDANGFDPQAMAKFFQNMGFGPNSGMNPFMMMQQMQQMGMPGMAMGMPPMMPGMPMMPMMPGMMGMDGNYFNGSGDEEGNESGGGSSSHQPSYSGHSGSGYSRGSSRGRGRGRGGGSHDFNPPTGPAAMRPGASDDGGTGPTRHRASGPGFHPYSR